MPRLSSTYTPRAATSPFTLLKTAVLALTIVTAISACAPYRAEIAQGNVITKEQVNALKIGMDKNAVLNIMGTPLIIDIFQKGRWDYVFMLNRQGIPKQERKMTLFFNEDKLERIEGGQDMPTEAEFTASLVKP